MKEIWKDVKGYEGLYTISNYGRIKGITSGKFLKPCDVKSRGVKAFRLKNTLCKNGKIKNITIHILVYKHFTGEVKGILDFKDGNYKNCKIDNLIDVSLTGRQKNRVIRVLDTKTGKLYDTVKDFSKHIGKTDMGAKYILKKNSPKYAHYKIID